MDIRVKTFVPETAERLDFLRVEYGCVGPDVESSRGLPRHRGAITVTYRRPGLTVEVSLSFDYGSDDTVQTTLSRSGTPTTELEQVRLGSDSARTGFQMRRALDRQAAALRVLLVSSRLPAL